jgi:hypothetical protein
MGIRVPDELVCSVVVLVLAFGAVRLPGPFGNSSALFIASEGQLVLLM